MINYDPLPLVYDKFEFLRDVFTHEVSKEETKTSNATTTQLASYYWYADGTKYSAERADGSGYVYKGDVIYEKATGASLVSELQNSSNMFTIKSGNNAFKPKSLIAAGANLSEIQSATGEVAYSSGSGGTIYWDSNSTRGGLDLTGSTARPAYIGLGHEMGHASDSNKGILHYSSDYTNPLTGATYYSTHQGLLKSEWRAVYRENLIREQSGIPLRTHYGYDITTGVPHPIGPRLLNSSNRPINYP